MGQSTSDIRLMGPFVNLLPACTSLHAEEAEGLPEWLLPSVWKNMAETKTQ